MKNNFDIFKFNKQLLSAIEEAGYVDPTPIQQKAIPLITAGHDIFGIAQTGTGKTAAFVLPILKKLAYAQGDHPRALILAPTRELALQIDAHIKLLTAYTDIRHVCVYGGIGPKNQIEAVQKGVDIVTATPGRFLDIYLKGELVVKLLKTMVLDEADKMMDMGFMPQIRRILEVIPRKRQNLLFSATMSDKIVLLSEEFLEFPTRVEVTMQATPAETVKQCFYRLPNFGTKLNLLKELLQDNDKLNRVIVFVRSKKAANEAMEFLSGQIRGTMAVIHANKGQNTRINTIEAFKNGEVRVLISTDVTARGIDVSTVSHVINLDAPMVYEDYIHRIGRTGRAGKSGRAITFVTKADEYHLQKIEKLIRKNIPEKKLPKSIEIAKTPFPEQQAMAREIDRQKKKEDPMYQGAFHEKKQVKKKKRR